MPDFARLQRALSQKLKCVNIEEDENFLINTYTKHFDIIGHSGTKYKVTISDACSCTCPDFESRNLSCKHILFTLLKFFKCQPSDKVLDNIKIGNKELKQLYQRFNKNNKINELLTKFVKQRKIEGECPICCVEMMKSDELVYCKYSCGNNIHQKCADEWHQMQKNQDIEPSCVFCRSMWKQ